MLLIVIKIFHLHQKGGKSERNPLKREILLPDRINANKFRIFMLRQESGF